MRKSVLPASMALAALIGAAQQGPDIEGIISKYQTVKIAIPDFRGAGAAAGLTGAFNQTLWADVEGSGLFKMVPKTMYPLTVPQQPGDFRTPPPPQETRVRGRRVP